MNIGRGFEKTRFCHFEGFRRRSDEIMNLTANKCSKANTELLRNDDEETSLVQRAIVYYQTNVKADRVS